MMIEKIFAAVVFLFLSTCLWADNTLYVVPNTPNLGNLQIVSNDQAINGCWTNIKASRKYAAKLLIKNAQDIYGELAEQKERYHTVWINTKASRQNGKCHGAIKIKIETGRSYSPIMSRETTSNWVGTPNLNIAVKRAIDDFFEGLIKK